MSEQTSGLRPVRCRSRTPPTSTGSASRPSAGSTSCGGEPGRQTGRRAVRPRQAVRVFELARAQGARRFADRRRPAVRRGAERRRRRAGRAARRAPGQAARPREAVRVDAAARSRRTTGIWRPWTCCWSAASTSTPARRATTPTRCTGPRRPVTSTSCGGWPTRAATSSGTATTTSSRSSAGRRAGTDATTPRIVPSRTSSSVAARGTTSSPRSR